MWGHMERIICEVRPKYVFVENSPMLISRGLGAVLGALAAMGFDARWGVLGAADVGAPHQRDRIWIAAKNTDTNGIRQQENSNHDELRKQADARWHCGRFSKVGFTGFWTEPRPIGATDVGMADGVAARVDRLKALGNGQVPACAAAAWRVLTET